MKVIICAAGNGSRLGLGITKCLVEVEGKKIIDWQLEALEGFEVYIVVGFQADKVMEHLKNKNCHIIVNDEWQTTTTAHSIALTKLDENCLILDGDLIFSKEQISKLRFDNEWFGITDRKTEFSVTIEVNQYGLVTGFNVENSKYEWACVCYTNPLYFQPYEKRFVYQALKSLAIRKTQYINLYEIDSPQDLQGAQKWMKEKFNISGKIEPKN